MLIPILILFTFMLLVFECYMQYGRNGKLINRIPGPSGYPIVGNVFQYLTTSRVELWNYAVNLVIEYPILKLRGFHLFIIISRRPDDIEIILNNTKHIDKTFVYDTIRPWLGTGLLISGGAKWHSRRKMLTPAFHFNILQQFVKILIEEGEKMTKTLKNAKGIVVKDLVPFLSEHTLNAICETAMGTSLQNLGALQQQYRQAVYRMGELFIYRFLRQWLHPNWIFSLTSQGREQKNILKILHGFTEQIIADRILYHERTNGQYLKGFDINIPTEEDDAKMIGTRKKRLAMLDLLIAASREGLITDLDIREEVDTFMFEGHDTTAMGICFTLALLAEHKEIQDRVRNEVDVALQENGEKFTMQLLQQLPYLDQCIKEALRLYPSVHSISRTTGEDVKLQSYLIPAGTFVQISINGVHRDQNYWPNPEVFDPDRFLPEKIRKRHPFSYIPFSAGSRNCIGQRFAMLEMRAMIASLIHNFYVEPVDYLKNLRIQLDAVLRPAHPLRVRFVPVCEINSSF